MKMPTICCCKYVLNMYVDCIFGSWNIWKPFHKYTTATAAWFLVPCTPLAFPTTSLFVCRNVLFLVPTVEIDLLVPQVVLVVHAPIQAGRPARNHGYWKKLEAPPQWYASAHILDDCFARIQILASKGAGTFASKNCRVCCSMQAVLESWREWGTTKHMPLAEISHVPVYIVFL